VALIRSLGFAAALVIVALAAVAADPAPLARQDGIVVVDGFAAAPSPAARSGAIYLSITNEGASDDRLIAVESDAADRVMLHVTETTDGVSRMRHLDDGIPVPAGQTVALEQGGMHVMLMGLTAPLSDGGSLALTLVFEHAGRVPVTVPVDRARLSAGGGATGG
jgi:periplasmic copper chaperone A